MFNLHSPNYISDPDLEAAVDLAIDLGMPLLVTGEPGTGKTKLANYIADKVFEKKSGKKAELLVFNTKTTSKARDLLYHYNTLNHFRDSQQGERINPLEHISFRGLGKAIINGKNSQYVVLVDEIDKAPRDFPNDVLFEFENRAFRVEEASVKDVQEFSKKEGWNELVNDQGFISLPEGAPKPFLILTSNSEKNLPDAFLRRCAYFHIPFPGRERLIEIVSKNVDLSDSFKENMLGDAVNHFIDIRDNKGLRKKARHS
jgi:MoxR-like ATPase